MTTDDDEAAETPGAPARSRLDPRRRFRGGRWALLGVAALVVVGATAAATAQLRADAAAEGIRSWHLEHARAECELERRIVASIALDARARDVLADAEHIALAEGVLDANAREDFEAARIRALAALDEGFLSPDELALGDAWQERIDAGELTLDEVDDRCFEAVEEAARADAERAAADNADRLVAELESLGPADAVDDARVVALEETVLELRAPVLRLGASRAPDDVLEAHVALADAESIGREREAWGEVDRLTGVLQGEETTGSVLDLVTAIEHAVIASWSAESEHLIAAGAAEEAAALAASAAAAQAALDEQREPAPRPPANPAPVTPPVQPSTPVQPPPTTPTTPVDPGPVDPEPTDPGPTGPTDPGPTDPGPTDPGPTDPGPTDPDPTDPAPTDLGSTSPTPVAPTPTDVEPTSPASLQIAADTRQAGDL